MSEITGTLVERLGVAARNNRVQAERGTDTTGNALDHAQRAGKRAVADMHEASAAEITKLTSQLDEARAHHELYRKNTDEERLFMAERICRLVDEAEEARALPKWNDLADAQKNAIADGILLPYPEERMQMALEAYNAIRALLHGSTK